MTDCILDEGDHDTIMFWWMVFEDGAGAAVEFDDYFGSMGR